MNLSLPRLRIALQLLLLFSSISFAQQYRLTPGQSAKQQPTQDLKKNLIERRFLSKSPQAQWFRDKTLAGRQVLQQRSQRSKQQRLRLQASKHARRVAQGTAPTLYPGIQFRDTLPAGVIPTSVASGDFNQDGHADFVVSNGYTSDLWIYFGKGNGTFGSPNIIPLSRGLSPVYLVAADLRGTGVLDLVIAEFDTSTVGVLLGNGDGSFGYEQTYSLPQPPVAIAVDDFNGDHKLDIVAVMFTLTTNTQQAEYIANLVGNGSGTFAAPLITHNWGFYSTAWNVGSGDVNNDGLPDLVITGPALDNSTAYINAGNGTFTVGQTLAENGPFNALLDARFGDLNEDGCRDAAVADLNGNIWILFGDCSGNFTFSQSVQMGDDNSAIRLADVNGDGHLDLVTSAVPILPYYGDVAGNTLSVAFGDGHGNFSLGRNYVGRGQSYSLAIADFNEDGNPDVVTPSSDTDSTTVYLNNGSGEFGFPEGLFVGIPGVGVLNAPLSPPYFADLNGDSSPDVLLLDEGYNGEYFTAAMLNDGTGHFSGPFVTDAGIDVVNDWLGDFKLGDFRKSGHLDLVGIGLNGRYSFSSNFIFFMPGNGDGTFGKSTKVSMAGADGEMAIGDFNADGQLDFVAVSWSGGSNDQLSSFLGNGNGTFKAGSTITYSDPAGDISRVFSGDFNRDGKLDVLVFNTGNGYWTQASNVWEFLGNGNGTFQAGRQLFTAFQPMTLADLNGDHWPDIIRYDFFWPDGQTQNWGTPQFTNYLDQPDGTFPQSSSYAPYIGVPRPLTPYLQMGDSTATAIVGNLFGDAQPDEIAFQTVDPYNYATYAQILMGLGDGTFTPTYDYFPFYKEYSFPKYAHDLNGDGISEFVELDQATSSMQVFKSSAAPALQLELQDEQLPGSTSCGWVFPNIPSNSDRIVTLSSSVKGVVVPASVTIPAGSLSQQFCYSLSGSFDWRNVFDVQAQLGSDVAVAYASQAYVFGFSESLTAAAQQVLYPGQSTTPITVTLSSSQGYASTVQLSCKNLPPGSSCHFASSTLVLLPSGTASTSLVIQTTLAAQDGGTIFVVADDGNVAKQQAFSYDVQPLIVFNSGNPQGTPASSIVSDIFIVGIPPYTPSCSGLPPGVTCSFSGQQLPWPSDTTLAMTMAVGPGVVAGSYPFQVNVKSGAAMATLNTTLDITDFAFQGSPSLSWAPPGGMIYTTVNVQPLNLFNGVIDFTCTFSAGGTCTSGSFGIGGGGTTPIGFQISVPAGTVPGSYTLIVNGTVKSLIHTAQFPIFVADYSGSLSGTELTLKPGEVGTVTATVSATDGFAGNVSLSCVGNAAIICSFNPATLTPTVANPGTSTISFISYYNASTRPLNRTVLGSLAYVFPLPFGLVIGWLQRKRKVQAGRISFIVLLLLLCLSCGGGGSPAPGGGGGGGGGGSSSYAIKITATASGTNTTRDLGTVTVNISR